MKHAGADTEFERFRVTTRAGQTALLALVRRRDGHRDGRRPQRRGPAAGVAGLPLLVGLGLCGSHPAPAQSLAPRAYVITPVAANAIIVQDSYLDGSLQFPGGVPITGAHADTNLPSLAYYHSFGVFGRSANVTAVVPYGIGNFEGTVIEAPASAHRTGFLDSSVRLSVNLLGGPAMGTEEFQKWRQDVLLGVSLTVTAPTGQYDDTRLINFGSNRWGFKPELGYSERWGKWVLDIYAGGWFYTKDSEFFSHNKYFPGTQYQNENNVGAIEGHISYDFAQRLWISLDANYWWGGATSLNGIENPATNQKSSRVGLTASVPLTERQSIKVAVSDGDYVRYGGNFKEIAVAWQYGWIGWKFH
ncbi:MAG TPA: transporter [Steroidobacteraceae bacterium]|nr:transporter [Steroidobacteraceae bacterium]